MYDKFLVRVRLFNDVSVVLEISSDAPARAIDTLHYGAFKELKYLGPETPSPIKEFGPFACVEVETGFEEVAGTTTVVYIDPHNQHLVDRHRAMLPGAVLVIHESQTRQ